MATVAVEQFAAQASSSHQPAGFYQQQFNNTLYQQSVPAQNIVSTGAGESTMSQPTLNQVNGDVYLKIEEQPKARGLRFRYKCEGRSAGAILGERSQNESRSYPKIQIHNFTGPSAIVVVSCVTKDDPPRPHPHNLVGKDCKEGVCTVKLKGATSLSFPNLGIQCTTKREVRAALEKRESIRVDPFGVGYFTDNNSIDLNVVRLAFQCFLPDRHGKYTRIVPPVVSQCIYDKKAVNDLVICRLSRQAGKSSGGDEVFMLTDKVNKEDIQIRFFEEGGGVSAWTAYGDFGQQDVHRQVAIVFKTPAYRDPHITNPVSVFVQLLRPSDGETSDPKPFQYTPDDPDPDFIERKRKRKMVDYTNLLQDLPGASYTPAAAAAVANHTDEPMDDTKDQLKQRIIKKALRNKQNPGGAVDSAAHAAYAPVDPLPAASSSTTAAAAPASAMDMFNMITGSGGAATAAGGDSAAVGGAPGMDMFRTVTQTINCADLEGVDSTVARFLVDGVPSLPSLPSFSETEQGLRGDLLQTISDQPLAAEVEVASEEPPPIVFSIGTQQKIEEAVQALKDLN